MIPAFSIESFKETFLSKKNVSQQDDRVIRTAKEVIDDIRSNGDQALKKYVEKFDGFVPHNLEVSESERKDAWEQVDQKTIESLQKAAKNIRAFHEKQLQSSRFMNVDENIVSGQLYRPIERVGIYVPGGTACYPSSVLMNAIPAVLAGVEEVIMVTPARDGEQIAPILSVAADIAGVATIYKIGGIQAVAALAYGTESIPSVDKIVGPGNAYVAAAKSLVYGDVGIDMIAGPSEVAIIADETAVPAYIAADLIAQAEHDENARAFLFATSQTMIEETNAELVKQCADLPRKAIAEQALLHKSATVLVNDLDQAFDLVNQLAPEHLEIQLADPLNYLGKIKNAGSVFLGNYTPEALGDYYAGPNHVLPTSGTAKFSSGLSVDDFIKKTTFLYYTQQALKEASSHVVNIATEERLDGHARAVQKRLID
ncbi:histidinol dehydrogenase [Aquibacillus koreensis]|uniref:Histidinol dehydrogenase n=1 Tax=Aquibacillus koreensis TaxID=279446 RepID=A0A9X3WN79_9BACI|nr:histidinol dehydrogenase [Aquibacillus koreensis]MCT2536368.1 histidinol dehydrogenase [Aquibacillus koreensis]MDC3421281.1 histidinol dehydrogenase [Aquibacillus koreensis]